jgi:NAD(P)-dependent dehydrogenase (short-subunit alcohol dehydrogenase family)
MTVAKLKAQQTAGGRLAGKAAIVTGAARGIGRAVAVDWHDQIDVNLTDRCNAIRAIVPYVDRDGGGRIIVTASTEGRRGTKFGADRTSSRFEANTDVAPAKPKYAAPTRLKN